MAWRDNLLPASFRGVPFYIDGHDMGFGRRVVENEFPLRDTGYVEDLGRKLRIYKVKGYVLANNGNGFDYFPARDALIAAIEQGGPGTLVHPYLGPLTVNARPANRVAETNEEGGQATFELEFVDAGSIPSPTSVVDTSGAALSAGSGLGIQLQASFGLSWAVTTGEGTSAAAALLLASAGAALAALLSTAGIIPTTSVSFLDDFGSNPSDAGLIAEAVTGFCAAYPTDVVNSQQPFDDTQSSRGPLPVPDPTYGFAALATWGNNLPPISPNTAELAQQAANQAALIALVQGAATMGLAALYAQTDFASENDAEGARNTITGLIDGLTLTASADGDDDAVSAYDALYVTSSNDLTSRGKQLPDIETINFSASLPALYLAEFIYQDATQAGALVARNQAPHPLFMPLNIEALST